MEQRGGQIGWARRNKGWKTRESEGKLGVWVNVGQEEK